MRSYVLLLFLFCVEFTSLGQALSPQTSLVDFKKIKTSIQLDTLASSVFGKVEVEFQPKENVNAVFLDARGDYELIGDTKNVKIENQKIVITGKFLARENYVSNFAYKVTPKKALYFWGWNTTEIDKNSPNRKQIWTQGQGKYTSHWLPSIDDMNDKIIFDLNIHFDSNYTVISNGKLLDTLVKGDQKVWKYSTLKPISSYLVALVIGDYEKKISKTINGTIIENYIYPDRLDDYESTYRYHKKLFDYLEFEIGVPYIWDTYRQVPVRDFLYAGMENVGCTTFDDDFIVDSKNFAEKNLVNISAHELAHQWFGNLITEKDSKHHWLHEGFATFYALKAEREFFGEDYYYFKLYENAELLDRQNNLGGSTPLVYEKASSLTFYQRGAWAITALEDLVGKTAFKKIVKDFINTYELKNVTTSHFLGVVLKHTNKDISNWSKLWLYNKKFPTREALHILTKSEFMRQYLRLAGERTQPIAGKYQYLSEALNFPISPYLGSEAVTQLENEVSPEAYVLLEKAFESNNPLVLKSIAETFNKIPKEYEPKFRKLLQSNSDETVEVALYQLWNNFEEHKRAYLDLTKNRIGDNDKNIRTAWLALALNTPGFSNSQRADFRSELNQYTYENHPISLRKFAFNFLAISDGFTDQSLVNLAKSATHPNWRFNKFCTDTLKNLLKDVKYQKRFFNLSKRLPSKVQQLIAAK